MFAPNPQRTLLGTLLLGTIIVGVGALGAVWSVEELNDACFIVKDSAGQKLAYVYFEDEPGRQTAAKLLSKDEARRIAANIAKLLEALQT